MFENLTWECHICKDTRPDDKISVLSRNIMIEGQVLGQENIRYCNDRDACIEGAKKFTFMKDK